MKTEIRGYQITPVPKPRQTQADRWKKRPCVTRWRAFADDVKKLGIKLNEDSELVIFVMPMPPSWTKKRKLEMDGKPHRQVPDIDNLLKGLLDAVFEDDSRVWDIWARKVWGQTGKIIVRKNPIVVTEET